MSVSPQHLFMLTHFVINFKNLYALLLWMNYKCKNIDDSNKEAHLPDNQIRVFPLQTNAGSQKACQDGSCNISEIAT